MVFNEDIQKGVVASLTYLAHSTRSTAYTRYNARSEYGYARRKSDFVANARQIYANGSTFLGVAGWRGGAGEGGENRKRTIKTKVSDYVDTQQPQRSGGTHRAHFFTQVEVDFPSGRRGFRMLYAFL